MGGRRLGGAIGFSSEQVFRGYSKSAGDPVLRGNLEYEHRSGLFGGGWISQVDFSDDHRDPARWEGVLYGGGSASWNEDWRGEVEMDGYLYDGDWFERSADYCEVYAALHFRDHFSACFAWADDAYGRSATTFAYELQARHSLSDTVELSMGLDFHQARALLEYDYFYWNAGAGWHPMNWLAVDLRYVDAASPAYRPAHPDDPRFHRLARPIVLSVTLGF